MLLCTAVFIGSSINSVHKTMQEKKVEASSVPDLALVTNFPISTAEVAAVLL